MPHTPGPWKIQDAGPNSGNIIRFEIVWTANGKDIYTICEIEDSTIDAKDKRQAQKMDEANARLIAASPELFEALELARQHILHRSDCRFVTAQCGDSSTSCTCGARSAADKALEVITKVKGR